MSMYFIYHSMTGMVNLVFTAALIALLLVQMGSFGNRIPYLYGFRLLPFSNFLQSRWLFISVQENWHPVPGRTQRSVWMMLGSR